MEITEPHLLIVDDDPGIRDLLSRYLGEQGYQVSCAESGTEMDTQLAEHDSIELVILDLMLPGEDGLSIAKRLRSDTQLPIIMLSARGEDIDKIIGLEMGADDYLGKPFNPRELLARIRAVQRRKSADSEPLKTTVSGAGKHHFGDFTLDIPRRNFKSSEQEISLTTGEFSLLQAFVEHPNRALSRDMLIDQLKGFDRSPFDRSIDVRVTRLRQKLEVDPKSPHFIHTVWGIGYMFTPDGKDQ